MPDEHRWSIRQRDSRYARLIYPPEIAGDIARLHPVCNFSFPSYFSRDPDPPSASGVRSATRRAKTYRLFGMPEYLSVLPLLVDMSQPEIGDWPLSGYPSVPAGRSINTGSPHSCTPPTTCFSHSPVRACRLVAIASSWRCAI